MEADFSGYATKANLKCKDGRTILPNAFQEQDREQVPLVWAHGHTDPENVLGHAILENRPDGVYAYGFFNNSKKAVHTREALEHGDFNSMSIWANDLVEKANRVVHGAIREVSLVLKGANPGALIDFVNIRHADGEVDVLDDEAIIFTGLELEHDALDSDDDDDDDDSLQHADGDKTIKDVLDSMDEDQKTVLEFLVGEALASGGEDVQHSDDGGEDDDNNDDSTKGSNEMKHNIFEDGDEKTGSVLSHDDMEGIIKDAKRNGSLKHAVEEYALAHGIDNIEVLFPDAVAIDKVPEYLQRRVEWVGNFLGSARKSPMSRIKNLTANLTFDEARAKGYVKGALKREEFFAVSSRETTPTTVYKKQALDRDDVVDITDFDVVVWLKAEMRLMLDEEIARAALIGDGRDIADEDKINEQNIRPIAKEHELYATTITVNISDASSSAQEVIDAIVRNRKEYKGTGQPNMYASETLISTFLLLKDGMQRRMYKSLDELASELRVKEIIPVEVMDEEEDLLAVIVNPVDYVFGSTAGGQVTMFDDFDIDYNKQKYLIETRLSGALARLKSALVVRKTGAANVLVAPAEPTFDPSDGSLVITDTTGVVYKHGATVLTNALGPYTVPAGETWVVDATPAAGYYFETSDDSFTFTADA